MVENSKHPTANGQRVAPEPPAPAEAAATPQTAERVLNVINIKGLHARASARFVETSRSFAADVEVSKDGMTVSGASIMGLLMLAAANGSQIHVRATGTDAVEAVEALNQLLEQRFGEES